MLVSKLRLATGAVALAVAAAGAAVVLAQQPSDNFSTPPGSANRSGLQRPADPDKTTAPPKVASKGIEDDEVPYASAPAPAVVRVEDGKFVVRQRTRGPVGYATTGQGAAKAGSQVVGRKYDAADVLVFDMKGNRLAPKAWREKFQNDQHVLVAWGGVLPNPRELVLFKDDTLLVVFPGFPAGGDGNVPGLRTTYRAVTLPDGSVQYQPLTYFEPGVVGVPPVTPVPAYVPAGPVALPPQPTPGDAPAPANLPPRTPPAPPTVPEDDPPPLRPAQYSN